MTDSTKRFKKAEQPPKKSKAGSSKPSDRNTSSNSVPSPIILELDQALEAKSELEKQALVFRCKLDERDCRIKECEQDLVKQGKKLRQVEAQQNTVFEKPTITPLGISLSPKRSHMRHSNSLNVEQPAFQAALQHREQASKELEADQRELIDKVTHNEELKATAPSVPPAQEVMAAITEERHRHSVGSSASEGDSRRSSEIEGMAS